MTSGSRVSLLKMRRRSRVSMGAVGSKPTVDSPSKGPARWPATSHRSRCAVLQPSQRSTPAESLVSPAGRRPSSNRFVEPACRRQER